MVEKSVKLENWKILEFLKFRKSVKSKYGAFRQAGDRKFVHVDILGNTSFGKLEMEHRKSGNTDNLYNSEN